MSPDRIFHGGASQVGDRTDIAIADKARVGGTGFWRLSLLIVAKSYFLLHTVYLATDVFYNLFIFVQLFRSPQSPRAQGIGPHNKARITKGARLARRVGSRSMGWFRSISKVL
jgi:hypothetical protein